MKLHAIFLVISLLITFPVLAQAPPAKTGAAPAPVATAAAPQPKLAPVAVSGPTIQPQFAAPASKSPAAAPANDLQAEVRVQQNILDNMKRNPTQKPHPAVMAGCTPGQACTKNLIPTFEASGLDLNDYRSEKADYSEVARAVEAASTPTVVAPEVPLAVRLSRSDVNRITCQAGDIRDVVFSKEKGISISFSGKDAYLKYRYVKKGGKSLYPPVTEVFIVCGEATYNLIAVPEKIPSQTIRLSSGEMEKIKKNQTFFSGMSSEKKIIAMITAVYKDEIPESFNVEAVNRYVPRIFRDIDIKINRIVTADGEGFKLLEYILTMNSGSKRKNVELDERDFMKSHLTAGTVALSLDRLILKRGESARLFICQVNKTRQAPGETTLRIDKGYEHQNSPPAEKGRADTKAKGSFSSPPTQGTAPAGPASVKGGKQ